MQPSLLLPLPPVAGAGHWTTEGHRARITDLIRGGGWTWGRGRYASLAFCHRLTVKRLDDVQAAHKARAWIDQFACGHACQRWHAVLDLETGQYVGLPMLERFCEQHPALVDITSRDPAIVRRLERGMRQVLFPGVARGMPWLAYHASPTTWSVDMSDGTYKEYAGWHGELDDMGLDNLLEWVFWEVAARVPARQANRMALAGSCTWQYLPAMAARPLVGSLHALLTRVVARCERRRARCAYYADHPDAPRWVTFTAAELCAMTEADMHYDPWCAYTKTTPCDCTKLVEQRVLAGVA